MVKISVVIFAVLGLALAVWTVATSQTDAPSPPPAREPSVNPFPRGIAAAGIVEAATRNVGVQAPEPGLVLEVFAQVNDTVAQGVPLFRMDARPLEAEAVRARGAINVAQAELERLRAEPRPEDLPPLEARVNRARADFNLASEEFKRISELRQSGAATAWEARNAQLRMESAQAALSVSVAELDRARAGAWRQEIAVAEARLEQAQTELAAIEIRTNRLTVNSPVAGVVLKRNIEPGEYVTGSGTPAMVVGDVTSLRVRAQVDEEDAPLLRPDAAGLARLRGATQQEFPLRMLRIEPLAQPKTQLTGSNIERVDTRVVEVLFEVVPPEGQGRGAQLPMYPGQIVDVFIAGPDER